MMQKTALITGATSGIGMATATKFAEAGFKLIITGRREARLKKLAEKLSELSDVITLNFDVRDKEKVFEMLGNLPSAYQNIDVLINNAGNAHGLDTIDQGDINDWEAMLDINVKGLLYVSKAVMPGMVQRKNGHIINIGSIAGKEVYPNGNVYCASKHAVDAISKAMRIDLNIHNIKVSEINPGLVETEFSEVRFKGDKDKAKQVYQGYKALQAEDIADLIHFMVTRPAHVNLAEVLILPTAQANAVTVHKE
jgi:NADP-dependent 3-hydroxy acid dehydrogenase YdfG